jgi:hypothetical protein
MFRPLSNRPALGGAMVNNTARRVFCLLVVGAAFALFGCGGGEQGDDCTKNDDCNGGLICQPIKGREKDYCCPTPPESSEAVHCHATK